MNKQILSLLAVTLALSSLLLYGQTSTNEARELYQQWKTEYGHIMISSPQEDQYRFKIFEENLKEINQHNSKLGKTYTMGVNRFTGLTQKEFKQIYLSEFSVTPNFEASSQVNTPSVGLNVDWVSFGAVSPVKDEGQCKANYAFSAIGGIEALSVILYKNPQEYSAQEIVDCSSAYGNQGCNGGTMAASFNFIKAKGSNTQNAYPYTGAIGSCRSSSGLFKISGYTAITSCAGLDSALAGRPISVAVDGNNFRSYKSGVFDVCGTNLSLAALLVGGTDLYYRLKLSWGTLFGENGYIRLLKQNNICGICLAASYPNAA